MLESNQGKELSPLALVANHSVYTQEEIPQVVASWETTPWFDFSDFNDFMIPKRRRRKTKSKYPVLRIRAFVQYSINLRRIIYLICS